MEESEHLTSTQELIDFRRLHNIENVELVTPTPSKYRKFTDKKGLIICAIILPFLIYSCVHLFRIKSDIRRIFFPVDYCGNYCGLDNSDIYIDAVECSGTDFTYKPYLRLEECVRDCPYNLSLGTYTCVKERVIKPKTNSDITVLYDDESIEREIPNDHVRRDLFRSNRTPIWKICLIIFITLGICIFTLFYSCPINTCLWPSYYVLHIINFYFAIVLFPLDDYECAIFFFAHLALITFVILSFMLYRHMFYALSTEAAMVLKKIRSLLPFTIIIAVIQFLLLSFLLLFIMRMASQSKLFRISEENYVYGNLNGIMMFFTVIVVFAINWAMQFVAGFQCMVIAGSVASWYFKENVNNSSFVFRNFCRTLKFHLGTIAFWALFQPWVDIFKYFTDRLTNVFTCPSSIMTAFENLTTRFEYFSKMGLIETAVHGQPLVRSGKRAVDIIMSVRGVLTGKIIVNLIWLMPQFGVFVFTALIARLTFLNSDHIWIPFSICFTANIVIIGVFFETSKIVANTLLICYFEHKAINKDLRPNYRLENVEKFIERSVEVYNKNVNVIQDCKNSQCNE